MVNPETSLRWWGAVSVVAAVLWSARPTTAHDTPLRHQAEEALRRAVGFFHHQVATHGGYVYRYSDDLSKREAEGKAGPDTVWVQPPGTPAVGLAYLEAYQRTGFDYLLAAAVDAARCLVRGQLRSGGWADRIEFAPEQRTRIAYRVDAPSGDRAYNWTTLDDDKTQSAMRFLIRLDETLQFTDRQVHEAVTVSLDALLKAQYPNGAWPQAYRQFPDASRYPVAPASYPPSWSRQHERRDYRLFYTLNDDALVTAIETMLLAYHVYGDPRYLQAARRAGDFLLLAQMPEPQPAWAQQYDFQMHPTWARQFEPPAVTGGESQGVIGALMRLYEETADRKYLEPVPRALQYLQRSALADGQLARFYELQTNRPLYFTRQYELTYDDSDLPTHYAFKVANRTSLLQREYDELIRLTADQLSARRQDRYALRHSRPSATAVRAVIEQLDERGAWVEDGRLAYHGPDDNTRRIISSRTFIRNLDILSRFLAQR